MNNLSHRAHLSPHAKSIIPDSKNREANDFYATPPGATEALLRVEEFGHVIWEPACGDGAISDVLKKHGHNVWSTDIVDYGYGAGILDFLKTDVYLDGKIYGHPDAIVTNPPFKLSEQFVLHALAIGVEKVAFFQRLQFLESIRRYERIFRYCRPTWVYAFSDRVPVHRGGVDTERKGGKMTPYAWFVWDKGYTGPTRLDWVRYKQ